MSYCFRIRFTLAATVTLTASEQRWDLSGDKTQDKHVFLASAEGGSIGENRNLVVRGSSFDTIESALTAGRFWMVRVKRAFGKLHVGADFGERGAAGMYSKAGLEMLAGEHGGPMLNDFLGLTAFKCEPSPMFASVGSVTVSVGKRGALDALLSTANVELSMSPQEEMAYSLYSASFGEAHADARFVMLMMAIEALLPEEQRADSVLHHIRQLVDFTEGADLPEVDKRSLLGSLRWLRVQSINQAGRKLAASLDGRTYMESSVRGAESPTQFFTRCYEMRSALVHGHFPRPTRQDVGIRAAHLERFVGDLLAGDLLRDGPLNDS